MINIYNDKYIYIYIILYICIIYIYEFSYIYIYIYIYVQLYTYDYVYPEKRYKSKILPSGRCFLLLLGVTSSDMVCG